MRYYITFNRENDVLTPENINRDEILFGSKVVAIAAELSASILYDHENILVRDLYREYIEAGKPHHVLKWLRPRLEHYFKCVDERPRWVQRSEEWPFLKGRPMTFIRQFDVPEYIMADGKIALAGTLYVFCAAGEDVGTVGWRMEYKVVCQFRDLAKAGL